MQPRARWGIALGVTLAIAGAARPASAGHKPPPDLSGDWRMDLAQSQPPLDAEVPRLQARRVTIGVIPSERGGQGDADGRAKGAEAAGEAGHREPGGRYGSAMLLPQRLRIAQAGGVIRLSDSTGTGVAEIVYGEASARDGESSPLRVRRFAGTWKGTRLDVRHGEGEGIEVTDSYWLRDKGRTLEIQTKVEYGDARPPLQFTLVYRKMGGA